MSDTVKDTQDALITAGELVLKLRAENMLLRDENTDLREDIMDLVDVIMGGVYGKYASTDEWVDVAKGVLAKVLGDE